MKILESYKKIAKSMLTEHTWDKKFGEPLPTLEDVMREADDKEKVYKTDKGKWAGNYDGDVEYFDDKEKASHWSQHGDMDFDDDSKDDDKKEPSGKLSGGDFDRDGGEKSDKGGDTKKVSSVDDDTYDETEDAMDNLRYSGTPSDEPMMIKHLGDMVDNFMSGNASDEDVDKAQEIVDTLDNISQTNDEDPEAFDKLGMALQVGINQHKKLKGESKTLEINGKKYRRVQEQKGTSKKYSLRETYERIGGK
jgi:hypothetical protein